LSRDEGLSTEAGYLAVAVDEVEDRLHRTDPAKTR
jgi:hypothetical protein